MIAYIAGKISGDEHYKKKFEKAQRKLERRGFIVLNPATLPEGMKKSKYLPICLAMIDAADVVVFLKDWMNSKGARIEHEYAAYQEKGIIYLKDI